MTSSSEFKSAGNHPRYLNILLDGRFLEEILLASLSIISYLSSFDDYCIGLEVLCLQIKSHQHLAYSIAGAVSISRPLFLNYPIKRIPESVLLPCCGSRFCVSGRNLQWWDSFWGVFLVLRRFSSKQQLVICTVRDVRNFLLFVEKPQI